MNDFDSVAYQAFLDAAADKYDFTTCQRPDGSKYGSNGRCIKGSETSAASKDDKKGSSKKSGGGGVSSMSDKKLFQEAETSLNLIKKGGSDAKRAEGFKRNKAAEQEMVKRGHLDKLSSWHTGFSKASAPGVKSGGATMDKASRAEYGKQAKTEKQAIKDIKSEMRRNGKTPQLEKKLKQTEARASKFERMSKTGVFEK